MSGSAASTPDNARPTLRAARCRDANATWDFYADGTFENRDGSTFELPAEHDQKCSPRKPKRKRK